MQQPYRSVPKLKPGDKVAVLSPSFAAPGFAPAVHEQALQRIRSELNLEPVEFPTTRELGASPQARAADVNSAFADPQIRAIFASIGGNDQITVIPHLDEQIARSNPKPFFGYSDNTNILNWLWRLGIPAFHGGSTQVHLGAGPGVDDVQLRSLRAALFAGVSLRLSEPGESEDFGPDWLAPEALTDFGDRKPTEHWHWAGPRRVAEGRSWGGCLEVIDQLGLAGRLPDNNNLAGGILMLETSEELTPASLVMRWLRALGERGLLAAISGVLVARPPTSTHEHVPSAEARKLLRAEQREVVLEVMGRYNPDAVVCTGVPFGHTRPQWILPYGGMITLDGQERTVTADFGGAQRTE